MLSDFFPKHLADRVTGFAGRHWVLDKVAEWVSDRNAPRAFLIAGEPGCGKTALSAWLAGPGEVLPGSRLKNVRSAWTAGHFCLAEGHRSSVQAIAFAQSLARQIAERIADFGPLILESVAPTVRGEAHVSANWGTVIGTQIQNLIIKSPDPEEVYDRLIRQPLARLCEQQPDMRIFILVDALDEALTVRARTCTIVDLLAGSEDFPPNVRFLLTSRLEPEVLQKFPLARQLNLSDPSFRGAVNDDVRAYFKQLSIPGFSPANIETLVIAAEGNFLYVRMLLDEIAGGRRKIGDFATLPDGLHALYRTSLDRLTHGAADSWRTRYQPLLGRLSVAATDVPQELLGLWTAQGDQTASTLHEIFQLVESTVTPDGALKYRLFHRSMADFLALGNYRTNGSTLPNPFHTPPIIQHEAIADFYLQNYRARWRDCDIYGLRYLPLHLSEAGKSDSLRTLLLTFAWLEAKLEASGVQALIADYDYLADQEDLQLVQSTLRLSAHIVGRDPQQLAGQLIGRLLGNQTPSIAILLKQAAAGKGGPWFLPLKPCLIAPGGPLIRKLEGHTRVVSAVAITPDGRLAVSASLDQTLQLWNLETGQAIRALEGLRTLEEPGCWPTNNVSAIGITADGRLAVSASDNGTLRVWDLESGHIQRTFGGLREAEGHTRSIRAMAVTLDGRLAVSGSMDKTLRVWDLASEKTLQTLRGHTDWVTAVAVTPDGRHLVSGSLDKTLRFWDLKRGRTERTLEGHTGGVNSVAVTPDGRGAVSASGDGTLRYWDLKSGQTLRTLEGHTDRFWDIAVTPDGRRAVSASMDKTLRLWDLESGRTLRTLEDSMSEVLAVAVTPDGRRAVWASADRTLRLWELSSGRTLRMLEGHRDWVNAVAITPDGRGAVSASRDKTLRVWNLETGQTLQILKGHTGEVFAVAVTPDGRRAVSASQDGTVRLWNLESGQIQHVLEGHANEVRAVAVTPDGGRAISASWDKTLRVWGLERGQTLHVLEGHRAAISAVAVTADGRLAVSASQDATLRLWDLETGQTVGALEGHSSGVNAVAVLPDARRVVSGSGEGALWLWDLKSRKVITAFTGDDAIGSCVVAHDGGTIIARETSGRVHFLQIVEADATSSRPDQFGPRTPE